MKKYEKEAIKTALSWNDDGFNYRNKKICTDLLNFPHVGLWKNKFSIFKKKEDFLEGFDEQTKKLKEEGIIYHWFCQNWEIDFEDYVTPIPLGVDYHTLHRRNFWGEKKTHFILQDINLNLISRKRFDDFNKRKFKLICDIHLNKGNFNKERQVAYQQSLNIRNAFFINKPIKWIFF